MHVTNDLTSIVNTTTVVSTIEVTVTLQDIVLSNGVTIYDNVPELA